MALSNVVLVEYTTLDAPTHPEQTAPYPDRFNYSGSPIAPVDLGAPYWSSNAGPMFFRDVGLPFGLTMDENTGIVTGTLSGTGTNAVDIYASNTIGENYTPGEFVWTTQIPPPIEDTDGTGTKISINIGISI